jgi:hypothetical protein
MYSSECRQVVELENRYISVSMNSDLKYSNGLVGSRKFQSVVVLVEKEMMEVDWARGSYAGE